MQLSNLWQFLPRLRQFGLCNLHPITLQLLGFSLQKTPAPHLPAKPKQFVELLPIKSWFSCRLLRNQRFLEPLLFRSQMFHFDALFIKRLPQLAVFPLSLIKRAVLDKDCGRQSYDEKTKETNACQFRCCFHGWVLQCFRSCLSRRVMADPENE